LASGVPSGRLDVQFSLQGAAGVDPAMNNRHAFVVVAVRVAIGEPEEQRPSFEQIAVAVGRVLQLLEEIRNPC
jgi:hypothetical protein